MKKKEEISWKYRLWKEGKYVDLWNLPHFMIGILIGFVLIYFQLPFLYSLFIVILLKAVWEVYEHKYVVKETTPNKILDILTGALGYIFIYYLSLKISLTFTGFLLDLLAYILIVAWGLYSMKKMKLFIKK